MTDVVFGVYEVLSEQPDRLVGICPTQSLAERTIARLDRQAEAFTRFCQQMTDLRDEFDLVDPVMKFSEDEKKAMLAINDRERALMQSKPQRWEFGEGSEQDTKFSESVTRYHSDLDFLVSETSRIAQPVADTNKARNARYDECLDRFLSDPSFPDRKVLYRVFRHEDTTWNREPGTWCIVPINVLT